MKIGPFKTIIPELFLVASVLYYWTLTSNVFNPIAIGLLVVLVYQIISTKSSLGLVISATVIGLSLFMVLALISEISEFEIINQNWIQLVIFGCLYLGLNLIMASLMFIKYLKLKVN